METIFYVPIGRYTYSIEIVPAPLLDASGAKSASTICHKSRRLLFSSDIPSASLSAVTAAAVATAWIECVQQYATKLNRQWQQFDADTKGANEYAGDIAIEEMGPVFNGFEKLVKLGVRFDPRFILKMTDLIQAAHMSDADADMDGSDMYIDLDSDDDDQNYRPEYNDMPRLPPASGGKPVILDAPKAAPIPIRPADKRGRMEHAMRWPGDRRQEVRHG